MTRLASLAATQFYYTPPAAGGDGGGSGPEVSEYQGSTMVFVDAAAPTGWEKQTTLNDYTLRVVSGDVSTGGTNAFTSTLAPRNYPATSRSFPVSATYNTTTLSVDQMAIHSHPATSGHGSANTNPYSASPTAGPARLVLITTGSTGLESGGFGGGHSHPSHTGTFQFTTAQPAISINVRYVDAILATKT